MFHDHLDVDVPHLHPRGEVADQAFRRRFGLSDDHVPVGGRGIAREPQREGGGGAQAMPRGVQRLRQQTIKVNVLTSEDLLLYLLRERWLLGERLLGYVRGAVSSCTAGGVGGGGGKGGGWFWGGGDGRQMLSAPAGERGTRGRRAPSRRSSIPCRLLLTRRWTIHSRSSTCGRPGARRRRGLFALVRGLTALPTDPVGHCALPAVGREVELEGNGAQLQGREGEQLAVGRRVLGRHFTTFGQ